MTTLKLICAVLAAAAIFLPLVLIAARSTAAFNDSYDWIDE